MYPKPQSLSDESLGSPRIKSPDLKSSRATTSHLPWWAEEHGDDVKKSEEIRQSWMKPEQSEDREKEVKVFLPIHKITNCNL